MPHRRGAPDGAHGPIGLRQTVAMDSLRLDAHPVGARPAPRWKRLLAACAWLPAAAFAQDQAQPRLPTVQLQAGMHIIKAEVADDIQTRARGLMYRQRLGPNEGMLFVFQDKSAQCFWMKNTVLPLSIAFIDDDGTVANIADMKPQTEDSHCSARPVRLALEMEQGWFAKRGVKAGDRIAGPWSNRGPGNPR